MKSSVVKSDLFSNLPDHFDCILLNPPMAAGRQLCFKMIEESFNHLNKGGNLQLVARQKKGGEMLSKKINEVFGNMNTVAKKSGFRIYMGVK